MGGGFGWLAAKIVMLTIVILPISSMGPFSSSETSLNIPEAVVPPPSQHNIVFLQKSDPKAPPTSPRHPSTPRRDTVCSSLPASLSKHSSRASTPRSQGAPCHWAFSSMDFNGVVSTSQASRLFNEAVVDSREVNM
ncbi:hypothetical protein BT96DRAFT_1006085 [Gymnopus androsaceus JB14]|uniref:Uncharacterized protein n=1 Tax=Gymnopus androsaceus JB14 TaxID=1447944 RepID=A0A6A4GL82_9AGAR|nr:hypothetical protein BT96DRAFT_1006085 [Gymnopus androsaceus JB14]